MGASNNPEIVRDSGFLWFKEAAVNIDQIVSIRSGWAPETTEIRTAHSEAPFILSIPFETVKTYVCGD